MVPHGFTSLIPALTLWLNFTPFGPNYRIGPNNAGVTYDYSPSTSEGSYLSSYSGYGDANVNATVSWGRDYVTMDPNGGHARWAFEGVATTDDDALISISFEGAVANDSRTAKFFKQDPTFHETEFGSGFISAKLQTGAEKYKFLEDVIFVGSQRFIFTMPNTLALEFKLSQVVQANEPKLLLAQNVDRELRRAN